MSSEMRKEVGTIKKHRIPQGKSFEGLLGSERYYEMKRHHRELTKKHRWLVRSLDDYFYCDGDRPEIPAVEILDCDWTPEQWYTRPFRHFYNPVQEAWYVSYAEQGLPPLSEYDYGFSRVETLILKNGNPFKYYFAKNGKYASWAIEYEGSPIYTMVNGVYTKNYGGKVTQGTFGHEDEVKSADTSFVIPVIRELQKNKYSGFYGKLVDEIIVRLEVPRNLI